ncbi:MAG: dockerin type I repeat-containing protein [Clostridia bacterium]|nr:dockerin type I repeat-containing protein [Clostridia bacterium]
MKKFLSVILALVICVSVMPFAFAASVRGDANLDGSVNSVDALLILRYAVGLEDEVFNEYTYDVNGDYAINSTDALRILMIAVENDNPLTYGKKELLKFYSDAMTTSCLETSEITYTSEYTSRLVNDYDEADYVDFYEPFNDVAYFENGYNEEYDMVAFDYCPYPWIEEAAVADAKIELVDGKYRVTITLVAEGATYDEPMPYYNATYAANYTDCTFSGLEDYFVTDSSAYYAGTTLNAIINADGYLEYLEIDMPFEIDMDLEHYEADWYLSATEKGKIIDSYTFQF